MSIKLTRRNFLKTGAVTGAAAAVGTGAGLTWLKPAQSTPEAGSQVTKVRSACSPNCGGSCPLEVWVKDDRVIKTGPLKHEEPEYDRICLKGLSRTQFIYAPDRVKQPMRRVGARGEGKWEPISWDEAFNEIETKLKKVIAEHGIQAVGLTAAGSYSLLSGFFGACMRFAMGSGATFITGGIDSHIIIQPGWITGESGGNQYRDGFNSKLHIYWGFNITETILVEGHFLTDARNHGVRTVAIDPRYSNTAAKCDEWISVRPGTDAALALGMMNVIVSKDLHNKEYLLRYTVAPFLVGPDGKFLRQDEKYLVWDQNSQAAVASDTPGINPALSGKYQVGGAEVKTAFEVQLETINKYPLEKASEITTVPADVIEALAVEYATNPSRLQIGYGLDRWSNGDYNIMAMYALATLCGQIGRQGGGCYRGEGAYPVGYNLAPWMFPAGFSTMANFMNAIHAFEEPYPIKAWIFSGNAVNQYRPNQNQTFKALDQTELVVAIDHFYTTTAEYADIILPACTLFEKDDIMMMAHNSYVEIQSKAIEPLFESKTDLEIFREIAGRLGYGQYFAKSEAEYMAEMLQGDDTLKGITLERLRQESPVRANVPKDTYVFDLNNIKTPSGRIEFYQERYAGQGPCVADWLKPELAWDDALLQKYPFVMQNGHCKFRVHSHYANIPWLLEINERPTIDINPQDAAAKGIQDGDLVEAFNDNGHAVAWAKLNEGIRPGTLHLSEGWWRRQYYAGSHQELSYDITIERQETLYDNPLGFVLDTNYVLYETPVDFRKYQG